LINVDEAFCSGTAIAIKPVGSVTYQGQRYKLQCILYDMKSEKMFLCSFSSLVLQLLTCGHCLCQCRVEYKTGEGTVSEKLCRTLTGIQTGLIGDTMGWVVEIE
jgi:branched-chain amino acid aminotransferase